METDNCLIYLRMRVNDRWYTVIVNMNRSTQHALAGNNGLVLGLVGQHGTVDAVSDGENVWNHCLESEATMTKLIIFRARKMYKKKVL